MAVKQILGKVTVTPKGEYSSSETYKRLDIVTSNGQSYIAKVDNTGVDVTNTNTWLQLVEKPEKGIDYFTEEDIAQLVSMVTDDSESEFNEYYNGKVSDFDSNASSKTSEFNSNYDEKVESFNTIFDTSTDNFDGNYETKLSAFNENASTQTSTFNSVVEQATSDFNSNASTLTETFNTNASEKTSAFNINASEKTQEFNDNVDEKTEQITSQLDNYVQFDNYPSNEKAGVVKSHINGFQVSNDGNPNAAILSKEQYDTIENQYFISKGTLENIKDDYVESSTSVKNLNNSLKDLTPKQDAEGTDNTFDDGLESPLYDLAGDGKSEQVVSTGRQLFDYKTITLVTNGENNNGVITATNSNCIISFTNNPISVESGESLYFSCDIKLNSGSSGVFNQINDNVNANATKLLSPTLTTSYQKYQTKLTYSEKTDINEMLVQILNLSGSAEISNIMISKDSNSEFEPYTGGQPSPSPDYEQPINSIEGSVEFACSGKNLLNLEPNNVSGVTIIKNDDDSFYINGTINDNWVNITKNINDSLELNKNYCFSIDHVVNHNVQLRFNYEDNSYQNFIITSGKQSVTFSLSKKAINYYIYFYKDYGLGSIDDTIKFQLEVGTEPTSYEPYKEPNEVTFNLNDEKLRSVGDVKDELVVDLDTGDYYKLKNIEHLELAISNMDSTENFPGWKNVEKINEYYPNVNNVLGNILQFAIKNNITINRYSIGLNTVEQSSIWLEKGKFNLTQTQWKEQYPDLIFKLDYVIPDTEKIKLGTLSSEELAKLKTFKGYNNVTVNTNLGLMNIRFTYGLDIKKYIDNKLAEISTAMIEEG